MVGGRSNVCVFWAVPVRGFRDTASSKKDFAEAFPETKIVQVPESVLGGTGQVHPRGHLDGPNKMFDMAFVYFAALE